MPLPTLGTLRATVVGVSPASIHGDLYFDVALIPEGTPIPSDESSVRALAQFVRVPSHLSPTAPRAGDRVSITLLLGQLTEFRTLQ